MRNVGATGTARAAQEALATRRPLLAVLVLDPSLADDSFDGACARLVAAQPGVAALMMLRHPDGPRLQAVCRHGARGVGEATLEPAAVGDALWRPVAGEQVVGPALVRLAQAHSSGVSPAVKQPGHSGTSAR